MRQWAIPPLKSLLVAAVPATAVLGVQDALPHDPAIESIESILNDTAAAVLTWQQPVRFPLLAGLVAGVVLVMAVVRSRCGWCRFAAGISGALVCALSLAGGLALDRQFEQRRSRAQRLIEQTRFELRGYDLAWAPADRRQWHQELVARLRDIWSLAPDQPAEAGAVDRAGPASADAPPSWVVSLPAHGANLFFVGSAHSSSLESARRASLEDALDRASAAVSMEYSAGGRRRSDPLDPARLRRYLRDAATIKTTWFRYEAGERRFRYYTLLAVHQMLTRPDVVRILAN